MGVWRGLWGVGLAVGFTYMGVMEPICDGGGLGGLWKCVTVWRALGGCQAVGCVRPEPQGTHVPAGTMPNICVACGTWDMHVLLAGLQRRVF